MTINSLSCKIVYKVGKKAEVEIGNQVISIPSDFLPKTSTEGDVISCYFLNHNDNEISEKKLAQLILEEILNGK